MAASLEIYMLGGLRLLCNGEPVSELGSRKAEALLVYLACTGRAQSREVLADLLWDERSQSQALGNLRRELSALRQNLGDYLTITRATAGLNPGAPVWVDANELEETVHEMQGQERVRSPDMAGRVERATMELYRGEFLEGFYAGDCRGFEEWQARQRQRLGRLAVDGLYELVAYDLETGAYQVGLRHAARLLELDSLMEAAHRGMMSLLAFCGQRGEALAQYETCREALMSELEVEPEAETVALYRQIQTGELSAPSSRPAMVERSSVRLPAFLEDGVPEEEPPLFVARQPEMERLEAALEASVAGQGGVVFLAGGPGRGKTALLEAFARRALAEQPDLLVVRGSCNAYTGAGDPYLPFRQALGLLLGDVQVAWEAWIITTECARRLWQATPTTIQALLEHGLSLAGLLVPSKEVAMRADAAGLGDIPKSDETQPGDLIEQCAQVLREIAREKPLLVLLDDLQWIDHGSVDLLLHLGRGLAKASLLIVGAYRPEELAVGRGGERHPLEKPLAEFKRLYGDVIIDLGRADEVEGRDFVEAYLDSKPNRLDESFRVALHAHTGGHPLFTIELLRDLQARGDLLQDGAGRWTEGTNLDWNVLPARVEGVIETQIERLDGELRRILEVASVEGELFSLQVLSKVGGFDEKCLVRQLSGELAKAHRLVAEQGVLQAHEMCLFRFRFRHHLFQQHIYNHLSEIERRVLHKDVAEALEAIFPDKYYLEIAPQLAFHYEAAGIPDKAIKYLLMAGDRARLLYAHQEAIDYYHRALVLLRNRGENQLAARTLMKLGLTHHIAFHFQQSRQAYDEGFRMWQRVGNETLQHSPSQELKAALSEPAILDPAILTDSHSHFIVSQLFCGLVELTPEMEIIPDLARSWEISSGGREYIFHLRDDARWSDGKPITAKDFEYAWKRIIDPESDTPNAIMLYNIIGARGYHTKETSHEYIGIHALDNLTLSVELEEPVGDFLYLLTIATFSPIPHHVVKVNGTTWTDREHFVTNGPFKLEYWKRGESMILERNHKYHGPYTGNLQRIIVHFPIEEEKFSDLSPYERNEVDILSSQSTIPSIEQIRASQRYAGECISPPDLSTKYLGFNLRRPPFDDKRVRQAFALATDLEKLNSVITGGMLFSATGGFLPPGLPGHSTGIGHPYDPERAKKLLSEAGFPGGRGFPRVRLLIPGLSCTTTSSFGGFCQAQWRENLGIETIWESMSFAKYIEIKNSNDFLDIHFHGWKADYPDPDNFFRIGYPWWQTGWQNLEYEALIEVARRTIDQKERLRLYTQADRILIDETPIIPIFYGRLYLLVKPWVTQCPLLLNQYISFKDVIVEPH